MGTLKAVFLGIWRGLDGLRKLLHLIVLLIILGVVIAALRASSISVPERAALVVAPEGRLVEQLSGNAVQRAIENARGAAHAQTSVWSLVAAIRAAARDNRIRVLVLDLDKMDGAGQPMLEELGRAIHAFRASGKPVIAYGMAYDQDQYYLAARASQVYLDPTGFVMIQGFSQYGVYFKNLLQKVGLDVNVFRVGKYKSAVEIFTRDNMSKADKEQTAAYLDVLWSSYQQSVTSARKLPADAIANYVNNLTQSVAAANGDAARVALQAGLVTGLESKVQVDQRLIGMVGLDRSTGTFNQISAEDYAHLAHIGSQFDHGDGPAHIGVIVASGDLLDGNQPPGAIGGASLSRLIRQVRLDRSIRAVVLRIDSPGGSVTAAEQIYRQLLALRAAGKPLVVSMGDLAASGGYYIAAPANQIFASPATLTGSIGIFAVFPTITQTLGKIGVDVDGLGTTPLAGQLSPLVPLSSEASQLVQSQVGEGYQQFVDRVAAGRHETPQQIDSIAQGRVWAGAEARRIGLVDHLGTLEDAIRAAAHLAHVTSYQVEFVHPQRSWGETLVQDTQAHAAAAMVSMLGAYRSDLGIGAVAGQLSPFARELEELARFSGRGGLYAYCFCRNDQ